MRLLQNAHEAGRGVGKRLPRQTHIQNKGSTRETVAKCFSSSSRRRCCPRQRPAAAAPRTPAARSRSAAAASRRVPRTAPRSSPHRFEKLYLSEVFLLRWIQAETERPLLDCELACWRAEIFFAPTAGRRSSSTRADRRRRRFSESSPRTWSLMLSGNPSFATSHIAPKLLQNGTKFQKLRRILAFFCR